MNTLNRRQKRLVIVIAALSQLAAQLVANMVIIALPDMSVDLALSAMQECWVNIVYLVSIVGITIPLSKLMTQAGVKKTMIAGVVLMIVSLVLSGFSYDIYTLYASRFIQGFSVAILLISIYMIIVEELEEDEVGFALGIVAAFGYIGLTVAPTITSVLLVFVDWRKVFLAIIPLFVVLLILLLRLQGEYAVEKQPIDVAGSVIYALMMVLFVYGISVLDDISLVCFALSLVLLVVFVLFERKKENPILNLSIFRNTSFSIGTFAALAAYFSTSIAVYVLTYHMMYVLEFEVYFAGFVLLVTPVIMIVFSIIAGRLSDRYDPREISSVAMLIIFISMLMFCFVDKLSFELIIVACALQGIGHGLFSSPNNKFVLTIVDEKYLPDASSTLATSKEFGKILSLSLYTLILGLFLEDNPLGPGELNYLLILASNYMMYITAAVTLIAAALLIYSRFFHGEEKINMDLIMWAKSVRKNFFKIFKKIFMLK